MNICDENFSARTLKRTTKMGEEMNEVMAFREINNNRLEKRNRGWIGKKAC